MIFMTFSCVSWGVCRNPFAGVAQLSSWYSRSLCWQAGRNMLSTFSWYFFLVIALDYFACFQKTWLGSTPQPVTVGKKGLGWDSLLNVRVKRNNTAKKNGEEKTISYVRSDLFRLSQILNHTTLIRFQQITPSSNRRWKDLENSRCC